MSKVCMSIIAIFSLLSSLKMLYQPVHDNDEPINTKQLTKDFVKHSGVMWLTTSLRSLSERNFIVPFLTYSAGPALANAFKLGNDAALVFQRIVLKTIGTADTSLFSYIKIGTEEKKLTEVAFRKLTTKITSLSLPLLGLIGLLAWGFYGKSENTLIFHIFCIIGISYLVEVMLLPYERLLEVKRKYKYLLSVYAFYSLLLMILIFACSSSLIGMRVTIALLCTVRLVSLLIMAYISRSLFQVQFPFKSFFNRMVICVGVGIILIPILYLLNFIYLYR